MTEQRTPAHGLIFKVPLWAQTHLLSLFHVCHDSTGGGGVGLGLLFHLRKLRHREVRHLGHGHPADGRPNKSQVPGAFPHTHALRAPSPGRS